MSQPPDIATLTRVFGRIGVLSFGGPAAQIALMHRELVEARGWLNEQQFLSALSFCMLLPGPEAMQLATYCGWRMRGVAGGLIAGLLFVLPGALVVGLLAWAYTAFGQVPLVQALFLGVKATVVVIVLEALWKVSKKALQRPDRWVLAALAFLGIFAFQVPFPAIIALAACYGALSPSEAPSIQAKPPPVQGLAKTVVFWGALWWAPVAIALALGAPFLAQIGLFFSQLAVLTFGGAYAVLAYMTQIVVQDFGWLTTAEMVDALGLAETTPGPLILVTEFVGFLAGYQTGGIGTAILAAMMVLWVTFTPCFLWIFAGAPYLDWIAGQPRVSAALSAITAAVVGIILNLSVWFALHVFFATVNQAGFGVLSVPWPTFSSVSFAALSLAFLAAFLLWGQRWPLLPVLGTTALAGAAVSSIA